MDPSRRPFDHFFHGRHHRIFSDAEKQAIADLVTLHYLLPGNLFTDATFQHIARQAYSFRVPPYRPFSFRVADDGQVLQWLL
jgi:hypothetical protein